MKIKFIDETRTTLTDYCKETIEKRISSKLDIFEDVINDIVIKISSDKKKVFLVKLIVNPKRNGDVFIAMASNKDLFDAIENARNKIYIQINKTRKKVVEKSGVDKEITSMKNFTISNEENEFDIVKVKEFDVKPMFLEEAITQMNQLGHDFFLYLDAETDKVNVIYKRKKGNYGLIETALSNN